MSPAPTPEFLKSFYGAEYWEITNSTRSPVYSISKQLRRAVKYHEILTNHRKSFRPSRILEIGCGRGGVVFGLGKLFNSEVFAIEPDEAEFALATKIGVKHMDEELGNGVPTFDLVVLSHVLEHQIDPHELVTAALQHLNYGGILLIEVPQGDWVFDGGLEHPIVFGKKSLSVLLASHGLSSTLISHRGYGSMFLPCRYLTAISERQGSSELRARNRTDWRWPNTLAPRIAQAFFKADLLRTLDQRLAARVNQKVDAKVAGLLDHIRGLL